MGNLFIFVHLSSLENLDRGKIKNKDCRRAKDWSNSLSCAHIYLATRSWWVSLGNSMVKMLDYSSEGYEFKPHCCQAAIVGPLNCNILRKLDKNWKTSTMCPWSNCPLSHSLNNFSSLISILSTSHAVQLFSWCVLEEQVSNTSEKHHQDRWQVIIV